jgi:hypothetical protein
MNDYGNTAAIGVSREEAGRYVGLIVHDLVRAVARNMSLVGGSEADIMAISGQEERRYPRIVQASCKTVVFWRKFLKAGVVQR